MKKVFLIFLITMFLVGMVGADSGNKSISNEMAIKLAKEVKTQQSRMWSMIRRNELLAEQNKILKELVIILEQYKWLRFRNN